MASMKARKTNMQMQYLAALFLSLLILAGNATPPAEAAGPAKLSGTIIFQTASGGDIYAVNPDGTQLRRLTSGMDPALSPDGQWVAFTRWDSPTPGANGSLWVIRLDGSGERKVIDTVYQPKSPSWSPDGKRLIFSMQAGGSLGKTQHCVTIGKGKSLSVPPDATDVDIRTKSNGDVQLCFNIPAHPAWGLRTVEVDNGRFADAPRQLYSYSPTWNPVNDWQVVYASEGGLESIDLNRSTSWSLTQDNADHSPAYSPDGSRLAVNYYQIDHWDIHVMNADGSGRMRLTSTPLRYQVEQHMKGLEGKAWNNVSPAWSPDGSQIAFLTDRDGYWEFWLMNADGSNQRPLFPSGALAGITLRYDGVDERMISWR